jgi:hypothetical protein
MIVMVKLIKISTNDIIIQWFKTNCYEDLKTGKWLEINNEGINWTASKQFHAFRTITHLHSPEPIDLEAFPCCHGCTYHHNSWSFSL